MSSRSFDLSQVNNYIDSTGAVKLDGQVSSYYLDYNNFTNTPTIPTSGVDFDPVGTDNSTNVSLSGSYNYLTIAGQVITLGQVDASTDISGLSTVATTGAYSDLSGTPTNVSSFINDANYLDSTTVQDVINSTYIQANQTTYNTSNFTDSAYVATQISTAINNLIGGAPGTLDTLNEIAAAINDDANAYTTLVNLINAMPDSGEVATIVTSYGYTTNTGTVTSVAAGSYLTGGTITTSGTIAVDATSANTASKVVARDASGNFSAGTITATLSGNASTATTWATGRTISLIGDITGTSGTFDGSTNLSFSTNIAANVVGANELNVLGNGTAGQLLLSDGDGSFSWGDVASTASLFHTLDNPNPYSTGSNDRFGISSAISGNYAIVGAYLEDDAGGTDSGKAYIYNVTTGALLHTLDNPNAFGTSGADNFGWSVAISGNYAIVGAYLEDDAGGSGSGKAYIYNVSTGALLYTLDNPNPYSTSANDSFGYSVAISGNYAIVGAYNEGDAGGSSSGKAYIFDVTNGTLLKTLDNPNAYSTSASDQFGWSVAISGNYAIVGAYLEDDAGGTQSGKAYIFNVSTGSLVHTLDNPNPYSTSAGDNFGFSVGISGNYAIVGAAFEDDAGGTDSGKAYIFDVTTGALLYTLDNPNAYSTSASDRFGYRVAISGNYAIVGAYQEDDAGGTDSGKAYIFDVSTGTLVVTLDNPNAYSTSATDYFGWSVAISGNYAIVGAYVEDDINGVNSGKAYIYQLPNAQPYALLNSIEAAGFGISNVVEDTTPQLGGNLDTNGYTVGNPTGANFSFSATRISTPVNKELYLSRSSLILTDLQDDEIKIKTPDNIPAGYTLTLPSTAGSSGQVLTTDGSGNLSFADASSGGITFIKKTTTYTASASEGIIADTTGGAWTLTLPATPSTGDQVIVADGGSWAAANLTVDRNGSTIEDSADNYLLDVSGSQVQFIYDGSTWQIYSNPGIVHSSDSLIIYNSTGTALKTIYSA